MVKKRQNHTAAKDDLKREVLLEIIPLISSIIKEDDEELKAALISITKCDNSPDKKLTEEVENLKLVKKDLKREVHDLKTQLKEQDDLHKREIKALQSQLKKQEDIQKSEVNVLKSVAEKQEEQNNVLYTELNRLRVENEDLFKRNDNVEQYGRREIIEILNIPKNQREDIHKVVLDFFYYKLRLQIRADEISVVHRMRIPGQNRCPPIYVKFISRKTKNLVMSKKKNLRGQLNRYGESFFIRENLTLYRRELFEEVKSSLKTWKFIWTKEGTICARKEIGSKTVKIFTYTDLDDILVDSLQQFEC